MHKQLYLRFETILSSSQCGFQKGYSAQHCLLVMEKNLKKQIDSGNEFGTLLTDFLKAFDCIDHSLLLAKLYRYGISHTLVKLIFSYFESRNQRTKISNCPSKPLKIDYAVP